MKRIVFIIIFSLTFGLFGFFGLAQNSRASTGPASSNVMVKSIVYGPPPTVAPTIDSPNSDAKFTNNLILVSGTCLSGLQVRVFKNNVFAGSTICSGTGVYELQINLFAGRNDLMARIYDNLDQPGPDSNIVTVTYNPPATPAVAKSSQPSTLTSPSQLIINYDYSVNTAYENKIFSLPFQIIGGVGPYATSIDWGDGTSNVYLYENSGSYKPEHIYKKSGNHLVKISVTDKSGQSAFLQTVVIVSGSDTITSKILSPLYQCKPDILWPLSTALLALSLMVLTTYALAKHHGEMIELKKLREENLLKKSKK